MNKLDVMWVFHFSFRTRLKKWKQELIRHTLLIRQMKVMLLLGQQQRCPSFLNCEIFLRLTILQMLQSRSYSQHADKGALVHSPKQAWLILFFLFRGILNMHLVHQE